MRRWLSPRRDADRLFASALEVADAIRGPSAYAVGVATVALNDGLLDNENMTQIAMDAALSTVALGYAIRLVEEAEGTARPLDAEWVQRLEHARDESPMLRQMLFEELAEDRGSEIQLHWLRQLDAAAGEDHEYAGETEVLEQLIFAEGSDLWFEGGSFFELTGYKENIWCIVSLTAAKAVNEQLTEGDASARRYESTAVDSFLRIGYLLRCGDAFLGYVPERVEGGDWSP
jgi:hypothetical protein